MTELQVLQYRTTYINGTPIAYEETNKSSGIDLLRLRLVMAALLGKDVNRSMLEFPVGDRNSIWPSKKFLGIFSKLYIAVNFFHRLRSN